VRWSSNAAFSLLWGCSLPLLWHTGQCTTIGGSQFSWVVTSTRFSLLFPMALERIFLVHAFNNQPFGEVWLSSISNRICESDCLHLYSSLPLQIGEDETIQPQEVACSYEAWRANGWCWLSESHQYHLSQH
jgi:hypothetical protein